jgi:hypothetical protein
VASSNLAVALTSLAIHPAPKSVNPIMKISIFSAFAAFISVVATVSIPRVSAEDNSGPKKQEKLTVDSPDLFEGVYQGKVVDLIWLFPNTVFSKDTNQKNVTISVRLKDQLLRFKAVLPSVWVQKEYIPVEGNWDKTASEFTISKEENRGYSREDVNGYIWVTKVVKVFLNTRNSLVVEQEYDVRCLENSRPPEQSHTEVEYKEFPRVTPESGSAQ